MLLQKTCSILAITLAIAGGGAARAGTDGVVSQKAVRIDDLNLVSEADARRLAVRLDKAAKQVCANSDGVSLDEAECRREAVARAINDLARLQAAADWSAPGREMTSSPVLAGEGANAVQ
jgi:UrcA family protein